MRNSVGEWLYGYSGFCGVTTCLNTELLTIFYGLSTAWTRDITSIICEWHSQMAIQLISKGVEQCHPYVPLINRIRDFLASPWNLTFQHTLREGNFSADWLAKLGSNQGHGLIILENCAPHLQLHQLILTDALGVFKLRPQALLFFFVLFFLAFLLTKK